MPIDDAAAKLKAAFDAIVAKSGPPKTHGHGPIVDDEWNRQHFAYVSAISRATGLDFVQLSSVEIESGNYGVSQILGALPKDGPEAVAARRLQSIHRLGSSLFEAESKAFLASLVDPALSPEEQRDRWLDAFVESWSLRTGAMPSNGFPAGAYTGAARASAATGLDYTKLATIEYKGGMIGLKGVLTQIPDLPNRNAAFG